MFREYYLKNDVILPPRFTRREYGFMFFDKSYVLRHKAFFSKGEIKKFLVKEVPRHAYYSTAYYKDPKNKDMEKKGWMGADLVFDLDADHIPETEGKSYSEMLNIVKREAEKLVVRYLMNDFGFDERDIEIVFSGGRGYHIYVRNKDVQVLGSNERREIVSYITGGSYDITKFLMEEEGKGKKRRTLYFLYPPDFGGWYGKISREIIDISRFLLSLYTNYGEDAVVNEINSILKNKKLSVKIAKDLFKETKLNTMKIEYLISEDQSPKLQILRTDKIRDAFLLYLKEKIRIRGEADEPVTTEIHRLIRLIGSLHGKTGFIVKPLTFKEFKEFNPLKDAIPETFKEGESKIIMKEKIEIEMNGENHRIDGEGCVPDYLAIFLVARGMADFVSRCSS
ncbi:MAG: DNA primase catalytic subunit PriS [Thermoplasmata archaeon]|nr:DNA primase catalytic subunit PriS [Thermoplasmata archaeon]